MLCQRVSGERWACVGFTGKEESSRSEGLIGWGKVSGVSAETARRLQLRIRSTEWLKRSYIQNPLAKLLSFATPRGFKIKRLKTQNLRPKVLLIFQINKDQLTKALWSEQHTQHNIDVCQWLIVCIIKTTTLSALISPSLTQEASQSSTSLDGVHHKDPQGGTDFPFCFHTSIHHVKYLQTECLPMTATVL